VACPRLGYLNMVRLADPRHVRLSAIRPARLLGRAGSADTRRSVMLAGSTFAAAGVRTLRAEGLVGIETQAAEEHDTAIAATRRGTQS